MAKVKIRTMPVLHRFIAILCVAALAVGGAHLAHAAGFAQANAHGAIAANHAGAKTDGCADHERTAPIEKNCGVCVLHLSCLAITWPEVTPPVPDTQAPDSVAAAMLLGRTVPPLFHPPDARV